MVFQFRNQRRWVVLAAVLLASALARGEDAPEIHLQGPPGNVRAGEDFDVAAVVAWKGESTRFSVVPGSLDAPAWGEGAWDRVEARQTADGTELNFVARFRANAAGTVSLPELHLLYTDPKEPPVAEKPDPSKNPMKDVTGAPTATADPNALTVPAGTPGAKLQAEKVFANKPEPLSPDGVPKLVPVQHTLKTDRADVHVNADFRWVYPYLFLAVMAVGLAISLGAVWFGRKKAAVAAQEDALAPWQTVEEALHNARRHRLDGDFYKFYRELQRLVQFVGGEVKSDFGVKLDKRVEEVGFQNRTPTEDELEGIMKDLERALARWKEGQGKP